MSILVQDHLDRIRAAIAINQHLLLALYDAIDDKDTVINQFSDVTAKIDIHPLYSEMSDEFYDEFERQRNVMLQLLDDARAS